MSAQVVAKVDGEQDYAAGIAALRERARRGLASAGREEATGRLAALARPLYLRAVGASAGIREQVSWARRVIYLAAGNVWWTSLSTRGGLQPDHLTADEQRILAAQYPGVDIGSHPVMRHRSGRGASPERMAALRARRGFQASDVGEGA